ncbi:hypothetical protein [Candidatus Chlorobium masyuteum]|uniref:hypothetical protein n=1 Tax=Candidatus Chlorobium masyuteum TaxID=2716876 RepID=UPI00141DA3A0|nr:hypothetical protein [Candidatus Chlorobium masyuteum]
MKSEKDKISLWIKKNALPLSLSLIIIGGYFVYQSNEYSVSSRTISSVFNGKITESIIYQLNKTKPFLDIFANVCLTLGIALFISAFFIRYIEEDERKQLEEKLSKFQEDTAKDAILSVFKTIIDMNFFSIIQKDLLNAKSIRKNANWQYDISEIEDSGTVKLLLKRTVSYEFHNISQSQVEESIRFRSNNNEHCKTDIISAKVRHPSGNEENIELIDDKDADGNGDGKKFIYLHKNICIDPEKSIEVVLVFTQLFSHGYIYETHSSRHPIINLMITVNIPKNYNFELFHTFSSKARLKIDEPDKRVYVVNGAIFKGQGVEFTCYNKHKGISKN